MEFAKMHSVLNWDDLRVVLAVARGRSLSAAARSLRVTHSTVFRRLAVIEQVLAVRLFERFRDGYVATPAGEAVAGLAARLATDITALEMRLAGQDMRPSGTVRIATTDTIAPLLIRHIASLRVAHPEIIPEITLANTMADLTRREADIALRPTPLPPETLVGRRVADISHVVYGSPDYLARCRGEDLHDHDWVGLDEALASTVIGRWLRQHIRADRTVITVDSLPALRDAACAGLGLALLPCYVGDSDTGLRRVAVASPAEPRSALWLLTHGDLRHTARIRAVMDHLAAAFASDRALLEGVRRHRR
jgi:DNA-binding transcriptional LysR family regulator